MAERRRPMPPPLPTPKPGLWRRTPPAIFPPIMGLFGLGLAWREAAPAYGLPLAISDLILGAVALLFAFALVAWLAKPLRRPAVLLEELRVLPGRAGLAAASLSLMLLAAALVPFSPALARALGILAFVVQFGLVAAMIHVMRAGPPEGRAVTPVFHLSFVGFILGGLVANGLGAQDLARWILWAMLIPAAVTWGISARQLTQGLPPAPLRPLLAIHLAPACLFTIVAHGAGMSAAAHAFMALSVALAVALLASARWLVAGGFSALWGAFTFPLAAFSTALIVISQGVIGALGGAVLLAATVIIPVIAFRILKLWAGGVLAIKTNAAEA